MKLKLQLIIESDSGEAEMVREVTKLERYALRPETLGLTLSEAKELLQEVQRAMVTHQTAGYVTQQTHCAKCGKIQSRKGKHEIVLGTTKNGQSVATVPRLPDQKATGFQSCEFLYCMLPDQFLANSGQP